MAEKRQERSEVLESGNIYFFYRPKVEKEEAKGVRDVERFYLVLSPEGKKVFRMIVVGQKTMPEIEDGGEKNWGFVDLVARSPGRIEEALQESRYRTKTRGERELPAARPAGEGVYVIARHGGHTHLAYALELPRRPDEVQHDLRIKEQGSYVITVKNPEQGSPARTGLRGEQKARFPKKLQDIFRDRRFADCDPPEFLDHEGAELILIGAKENPERELGVKLETDTETEQSADIFKELKLKREKHPVAALFKGKWEPD